MFDKLPELRVCPFCKRHATIVMHPGLNWDGELGKGYTVGGMRGLWYVGCSFEFFETVENKKWCEVKPAASWYASLEEAVNHWQMGSR